MIDATQAIFRAFSVLCVLPLVKYAYRRFSTRRAVIILPSTNSSGEEGETAVEPLLHEAHLGTVESGERRFRVVITDNYHDDERENGHRRSHTLEDEEEIQRRAMAEQEAARKTVETQWLSAAQELWICRVSFMLDTLGMLLVSASQSPVQVAIGTSLASPCAEVLALVY